VVAKRLDQAYRAGGRTWRKVRTRTTAEAVVGGVLRAAPRVSGRTTPLSLLARSMMINVLQSPVASHPWPRTIRSSFGQLARKPVAYTKVNLASSSNSTWTGRYEGLPVVPRLPFLGSGGI
jgi:hypothetical protein